MPAPMHTCILPSTNQAILIADSKSRASASTCCSQNMNEICARLCLYLKKCSWAVGWHILHLKTLVHSSNHPRNHSANKQIIRTEACGDNIISFSLTQITAGTAAASAKAPPARLVNGSFAILTFVALYCARLVFCET